MNTKYIYIILLLFLYFYLNNKKLCNINNEYFISSKKIKILCFTPSYKRHKMLRCCIKDIQDQTYKNIHHSINVTYDNKKYENIEKIFDDLNYPNLTIQYNLNSNQNDNYLNCLKKINIDSFDLFVKIDDDEIYKKKYIETIVNFFNKNKNVDIVTSPFKYQLNGNKVIKGKWNNLGGNPKNTNFNMCSTLAFNRKALDIVKSLKGNEWEDKLWRNEWTKHKLKHKTIDNTENVIWYIHGKNVSTSSFFKNK
jgi:hypothetical protein